MSVHESEISYENFVCDSSVYRPFVDRTKNFDVHWMILNCLHSPAVRKDVRIHYVRIVMQIHRSKACQIMPAAIHACIQLVRIR